MFGVRGENQQNGDEGPHKVFYYLLHNHLYRTRFEKVKCSIGKIHEHNYNKNVTVMGLINY